MVVHTWKIIALIVFYHCHWHPRRVSHLKLQNSGCWQKIYFLHAGAVSNNLPSVTTSIEVAHNTTISLKCRGRLPYPLWYVNGSLTESPQYTVKNPGVNEFVGELTLSGNATCGILDLRCKEHNSTVYIISSRLTVKGLYYNKLTGPLDVHVVNTHPSLVPRPPSKLQERDYIHPEGWQYS